jgi:mono/diheme cytochrome c family protein
MANKIFMKRYIIPCIVIVVLMSFQGVKKNNAAKQKPITAAPVAGLKASIDRGKTIYLKRCLVCHQVDGGGVPHLNAPLDGASQVTGNDKARIIKIVLNGMTEKVELDGEIYSNNMLPQKDLSDQEIADVLTYARNSWTNKASAVTVAEVKVVRAKIK